MTDLDAAARETAAAPAPARADLPEARPDAPWLRRFPLRSPTLPPATHTNAYLLGEGELLLVDPGTPDAIENDRLLAAVGDLAYGGQRVAAIFLTHHHPDHVAGAAYLQERLGVPLLGHRLTAERVAAQGLAVVRLIEHGELLPFGRRGVTALHTPGHAPGHLCLLDQAGGGLIAGDMVASVGTIVVNPFDDGDMGVYLRSLGELLQLAEADRPLRLWPAHGASVGQGADLLRFYIHHRQLREAKVLAALPSSSARPATLFALVPGAYDDKPDVDPALAAVSLLAHLRKLADEGQAVAHPDGTWSRA